jgi:hypothetical protein
MPKSKARSRSKSKAGEWYRVELWWNGEFAAAVEGKSLKSIEREIAHYAMIYGQDGSLEVRFI